MEDAQIAHLAGLFDAVGGITVHVTKSSNYAVGYRYQPVLRLNRSTADEALIGKLIAYCEDQSVQFSLSEKDKTGDGDTTSYEWTVKDPVHIERFLEPMMPYLVSRYEEASLMLEIIVPAVKKGAHREKEGFYELMDVADRLRSSARYGPDVKYTKDYFADEWGDELAA